LRKLVEALGAAGRIELLGYVPDEELPGLMARHRAFLFPQVEDFGITPLEAAASGLPVIAFGEGGALDTVVHGVTGMLYRRPGVDGLIEALDAFEREEMRWDPHAMRAHAESFSRDEFQRKLQRALARALREGPRRGT